MKKGQTSVRGGVQDALCPFTVLNITQGANVGSHKGTEAIDTTNGDASRAPYYAPVDLKVARIISTSNTVLWHSLKPVRLSNGKVSNITIATAHDNTINFKVGFTIKQGVQMGNMGNAGITSGTGSNDGVHAHIEQGYGHQTEMLGTGYTFTIRGKTYPVYGLKQQIPFESAYFMDGTTIRIGIAKWLYLKDVAVNEAPKVKSSGKWQFDLDHDVRIRNGKEGLKGKDTGLVYKNGMSVNYDGVYTKDGYTFATYISNSGVRRSVAIGKGNTLWGKNV